MSILTLICACVLSVSPIPEVLHQDAEEYFKQGKKFEDEFKSKEAVEAYTKAIELRPKWAEAYYARAHSRHFYLKHKDPNMADRVIEDCTKAIQLGLKTYDVYDLRGGHRIEKKDYDGAISDAEQAIKLDPGRPEAYFDRGRGRRGKGDYDGAIADFTKGIERYEKKLERDLAETDDELLEATYQAGSMALRTPYFEHRAEAKWAKKDYDGAIVDYTWVNKRGKPDADTIIKIGRVKIDKGDYDGAIVDLTEAIKLDSKNANGPWFRGLAYERNRSRREAIADYTRVIELAPHFSSAYTKRGLLRDVLGDFDGAIDDFTKVIELRPKDIRSYRRRAYSKSHKNDHDGALADYTKAIEIDPNNKEGYYYRGSAKQDQGDHDGAIEDSTKAIELDPKYPYPYYQRGTSLAVLGKDGESIADFTRVIELSPKDGLGYFYRGLVRYNRQSYKDALADFRKTAEFESTTRTLPWLRIWMTRSRMGEQKEASEELRKWLGQRESGRKGDWYEYSSRFLLGEVTEAQLFDRARAKGKEWPFKGDEQQAYFLAGTKKLLEGGKKLAKEYFQKCIEIRKDSLFYGLGAAIELKRLD